MTAEQEFLTNIRCDDCKRLLRTMAEGAIEARKKAREVGWKSGRRIRGHGMYDACSTCELPEGYREYHR